MSSILFSQFSRREFLRHTGAAAAWGAFAFGPAWTNQLLAAEPGAAPKNPTLIGSNIFGWGQYYQREGKKLNVDEVLSALRDTGYDYLEGNLDVNQPDNNARFAEQMKAKGLKPVTLYSGARLHEAGKAKEVVNRIVAAAKVCRQAGFRALSCNPDPIGREKTDEELENQAAALTELGTALKEIGLRLGVHHHMPEMANHAREFHFNFRQTDPGLVGFCYDVHWVYRGGVMPQDALREYGHRIVSWHLRQSRNGIWWEELDSGDIDYEAIARFAKEHALARLFTVELALENGTKITRSAVENHRRSREFARRVFGD
jgi:inosose dehydratase